MCIMSRSVISSWLLQQPIEEVYDTNIFFFQASLYDEPKMTGCGQDVYLHYLSKSGVYRHLTTPAVSYMYIILYYYV